MANVSKPTPKVTALELREMMLIGLKPFAQEHINVINDDADDYMCTDQATVRRTVAFLEKIVLSTQDVVAINVQNASDILQLLKAGTISVTDAKELMILMSEKANIDLAAALLETPIVSTIVDGALD